MKQDRVVVHCALMAVIACRVVLVAGCTAEQNDPYMTPATIGAAAQGEAGSGGVEEDEDEGSSEEGSVGDGESEEGMGDGDAPADPSFGEVYDILAASCGGGQSGCHIDGMSAELAMPDAAAAHAALVDVASKKCAGELLVTPGHADQSVLVTVLEGGAECVKAMPLGRDPLSAENIATIRAWIDAGAKND